MVDKVVKVAPLLGALLVFCGVLKLIFYYSYFDIQIINYLQFQEIITSFFEDINIILVFGMTMLLNTFFTLNIISNKTSLGLQEVAKKMMDLIFRFRLVYFLTFLLVFLILGCLLYFDKILYNYLLIYVLIFLTIQMLTFLVLSKDQNDEVHIPTFYFVIIISISLSFSIFLFARKDIQETISNKSVTKIVLLDEIIICNQESGNIYLGKTSKYDFIKVKKSNSVLVIPNTQISKYEFK